ncbi:hypothetical protein [Mesorhizobium sp.]|uniref:VpaChn25_0724 family phage protein n=1 Tax=Mesorhizobium sp. TaxID=1871066 RepID=UPI0012057624|nr:hypothetical protein [Mesorhizobium sp.]TIL34545.1 MAG: hypothetical protein E5Y85_09040 [Mesorhizobium sp.]TIM47360.1 MAG: hypothetical protein E5Y56_09760 [Mesorhizobium sp.]
MHHSNEIDYIEGTKREHRALALLRFLKRQPCSASNDRIVAAMLDHIGLSCSRQELRTSLGQAEAAGLVSSREVDSLLVVALTTQGADAADGKIDVEGVLKPGADCPY